MSKLVNDGKSGCLVPGCQRTIRSRGLCDTHYTGIALKVAMNKYTWEQLEKAGACLSAKKRGTYGDLQKFIDSKVKP